MLQRASCSVALRVVAARQFDLLSSLFVTTSCDVIAV